jgi:hypothetical protein
MNTITMLDAETHIRATRTAPMPVFQNNFTGAPRMHQAGDSGGGGHDRGRGAQAACHRRRQAACAGSGRAGVARTLLRAANLPFHGRRPIQPRTIQIFPGSGGRNLPDARALRRFRAENRAAIHRCLVAALRFLVEQKISAGVLTKVNGPQLAEEAGRRIVMAAFADGLELDGE